MKEKPNAIVLCHVLTGLATVRGLAAAGIKVHAVTFDADLPVHFSRHCRHVKLTGMKNDAPGLINWIVGYAKKIGNRPVIIPTSDSDALLLAKHYEILAPHCRLWTTSYHDLWRIISKNGLYSLAEAAGVDVIPAIHEPTLEKLDAWSRQHPGPYFLKPFYEAVDGCSLGKKNMILPDRNALLDYVMQHGSKALIIQRMIRGGDGYIFDCYGLCNASGRVLAMASHRRLRQHPPNVGSTTYGEIPAHPEGKDESVLFENTARLLNATRYHGIFGIEWLQDRESGKLYIIDFNARPFTSIGHLTACGLNLPFLAYQELTGADMSGLEVKPHLKHKFWIDMERDLQSLSIRQEQNKIDWFDWFKTVLSCRSSAYWDWTDPVPGIYQMARTAKIGVSYVWKKMSR